MHFSIPATLECREKNGSAYTGYNIHINGEYHCTVRYKQLHSLHEQLKKLHETDDFPSFPPKTFWPLTESQVEERRFLLEKYIQAVGQIPQIKNGELFNAFLLTAQHESTSLPVRDVTLNIFLMNGYKVEVAALSNESSYSVLEKVCNQINLPNMYVYYFALFLIEKEENGELVIIRKLQDFESPYISQRNIKNLKGFHKIMIRRSYWDIEDDLELMRDSAALNLLYVQTISDIEKDWIFCNRGVREQLTTLQARGAKREYLELARKLKYYGFVQFKPCTCDYPVPESKVIVSAGNQELNLRVEIPGGEIKEGSFKVTRMRCWRIVVHNNIIDNGEETVLQKDPEVDLSFEYLIAKKKLQWITITSKQAILISVCLQSIVDELMLKKTGAKMREPQDYRGISFYYMKRDGSRILNGSQSSSSETLSSASNGTRGSPVRNEPTISMRRLSEKLSSFSVKSSKNQPLVENDAFDGIDSPTIKTEPAEVEIEEECPEETSPGDTTEPEPSTSIVFCAVKEEPLPNMTYEGDLDGYEDEMNNEESNKASSFACHHCGFTDVGKMVIKTHIVENHTRRRIKKSSEGFYSCPHCDFKATDSQTLKKHTKAMHAEEAFYSCLYCKYRSPLCTNLKRHIMSKHSGERPSSCPHCQNKSSTTGHLKNHIISKQTKEKPFSCRHCEYSSVTSKLLKNHIINKHTNDRPFSCKECEYTSARNDNLKRHIMTHHTGERPYCCPHCDYITATSNHLKNHVMAKHTGERPYPCPHCEYRTVQADSLKKHVMAKHTGERPYPCPHCEYRTVQSDSLKKHVMAKHTAVRPYSCPYCEYCTVISADLKIHIMSKHTGERPYSCSQCDYKSVTAKRLKEHSRAKH